MNRWLAIRRLRGPAFVILFGVTALLNQVGILSFGRSWPLYLILAGLLMLAERATMRAIPHPFPRTLSVNASSIVPVSATDTTGSNPTAEIGSTDGKWGA